MDKKQFETVNVCALFVLILFLITGKPFLLYIGIGLLVISVFIKPLDRLFANGWLKLAFIIGTFVSSVLLTLFFFVVFTPLALIRRLFNKDLLEIKRVETDTHWKTVDKEFDSKNLENIW